MFKVVILLSTLTCVFSFLRFDVFNEDLIWDKRCFGHSMLTREPCPEGYDNEDDCTEQKCCWDETFEDAYKCFKPRDYPQNLRCSIGYRERLSCTKKFGDTNEYYNVNEYECSMRGCCYDPENPLTPMWRKIYEEKTKNGKTFPLEKARVLYTQLYEELRKNPIPSCFVMQDVFDGRCAVPNNERKPCGSPTGNVTLGRCIQAGCCFLDNIDDEVKCFHRDYRYDANEDCRIDSRDSERYYRYDMNLAACEREGFCYEHPHKCYYSISKLEKLKEERREKERIRQKGVPIKANEITFNDDLLKQPEDEVEFCWCQTYGRGVGRIPSVCEDLDKQGLLCYPKCKENYRGVLFVCWQDCPEGFTDHGAFCFKPPPYGRGVGYPWKFGDALNDKAMFSRCEKDRGKGNCEKWGLVVYPKCRKGYHNVGCCICSPDCKEGQVDIGISCAKKSYTRATILPSCEADQDYDAGLCYKKCNKGYNGIGPVCWGTCPAHAPVRCGMGCAIDHETCGMNLFDQVTSAIDVVTTIGSTIASAGTSLAAKTAIKTSAKIAAKNVLKKVTKLVSKEGAQQSIKIALKKGGNHATDIAIEGVANNIGNLASGKEDEWEWEEFDPTGIAAAIKDFNHPVCKYT